MLVGCKGELCCEAAADTYFEWAEGNIIKTSSFPAETPDRGRMVVPTVVTQLGSSGRTCYVPWIQSSIVPKTD